MLIHREISIWRVLAFVQFCLAIYLVPFATQSSYLTVVNFGATVDLEADGYVFAWLVIAYLLKDLAIVMGLLVSGFYLIKKTKHVRWICNSLYVLMLLSAYGTSTAAAWCAIHGYEKAGLNLSGVLGTEDFHVRLICTTPFPWLAILLLNGFLLFDRYSSQTGPEAYPSPGAD